MGSTSTKDTKKEQQSKCKENIRKEIIKLKAKINEIEIIKSTNQKLIQTGGES